MLLMWEEGMIVPAPSKITVKDSERSQEKGNIQLPTLLYGEKLWATLIIPPQLGLSNKGQLITIIFVGVTSWTR